MGKWMKDRVLYGWEQDFSYWTCVAESGLRRHYHELNLFPLPVTKLGVLHINLFSRPQNIPIKNLLSSFYRLGNWGAVRFGNCWGQTLMISLPKVSGRSWHQTKERWKILSLKKLLPRFLLTWETVRRREINIVIGQPVPKCHSINQARVSKINIWAKWRKKNIRLALNMFIVSNVLRNSWKSSTNSDCEINIQGRN